MTRILITGARAPATLDLARRLAASGATVFVAESQPLPLASLSSAVSRSFRVRPPRFDPDGFVEDLRTLVRDQHIDRVLPTCEEIFWVARAPDLPMVVESVERLRRVHDKYRFILWCQEIGLRVPRTMLANDPAALLRAVDELGGPSQVVVKPCYSRFGTSTMVRPDPDRLARVSPSPAQPWVVQSWVPGQVACTWSWVHAGRVTAYADYSARYTARSGSALYFEPLQDVAVRAWVETFAAATSWSGHLAFDLVLGPDGPVAIECNPRLTSGIHLFRDSASLARAMLEPGAPVVTPRATERAQIAAGMALYALPTALGSGRALAWLRAFLGARDVAWDAKDPWPFVLQGAAVIGLAWTAIRAGEGLLDASTWDFRWNGEDGPGEGGSPG